MATKLVLDAMIPRADFAAVEAVESDTPKANSATAEQLDRKNWFGAVLRKPDFQRETNFWSLDQLVEFLISFVDQELVPAAILWKSSSYVFVIDGAHRMSAIRAWIEDDYGDGKESLKFFGNEISVAQKKIAAAARQRVNSAIGTYSHLKSLVLDPDGADPEKLRRGRNLVTRAFEFQWVSGNADKAETSFFKINTRSSVLDKTEESLLRNRQRSSSVGARSIVRAGRGHKYTSSFQQDRQSEIAASSLVLHTLLFSPELETPVRTLDLPISGSKSTIDALTTIVDVFGVVEPHLDANGSINRRSRIDEFPIDASGAETAQLLERTKRLIGRVAGNGPESLGLHPAVYYYSHRGIHIPDLMLGVLWYVRKIVHNNNKTALEHFTQRRSVVEDVLIAKKSLILQATQLIRSALRPDGFSNLIEKLVSSEQDMSDQEIVYHITGRSGATSVVTSAFGADAGDKFSRETKSEIAIRQSLDSAMRCPICNGYLDPVRSASYDHVIRLTDGGTSNAQNGQLTHPYCNTAVKG